MSVQSNMTDDSIEAVIERYSDMVYSIALLHTRNQADADDVYQEVFLVYHRKAMQFNEEDHRKAWLIKVTLNCSRKVTSSLWRQRIVPLDSQPEPSVTFETRDDSELYTAIKQLPVKYRQVIQLFYLEELSINEISEILNIKVGTIKVQLNRGRELLKGMLKGEWEDEDEV